MGCAYMRWKNKQFLVQIMACLQFSPKLLPKPGVGVIDVQFVNFVVQELIYQQNYLFHSLLHIHIWQVLPQLSFDDICKKNERDIQ